MRDRTKPSPFYVHEGERVEVEALSKQSKPDRESGQARRFRMVSITQQSVPQIVDLAYAGGESRCSPQFNRTIAQPS